MEPRVEKGVKYGKNKLYDRYNSKSFLDLKDKSAVIIPISESWNQDITMPIIQSCCCWRSLRRGCYASALYTLIYFSVTIVTMGHFIEVEQRYLNGDMTEPESESFLEPEKITPITVSLNITLLACSTLGLIACVLLVFGVYKDIKFMLLPWVFAMGLETTVEVINLIYLFYLQTLNFNPITSFLFTLDFFIIVLNIYAMICVISQFQEYLEGRGTAAFDYSDR
ncbi:unnamed protein product, partial [Brenthis ino]